MGRMNEKYKEALALPVGPEYMDVAPINVFDLCTQCSAVREHARASLSRAVRESFAARNSLTAEIRRGFDAGQVPVPEDKEVDGTKLHKLMTLLLNAKLRMGLVRLNPKFIAREGFHQLLTGSVDALVRDNDELVLVRLSRAKKDTTDENSVLLYLLLAYMVYPEESKITYRKIHILKSGGREENYTLEKSVLEEDPLETIKRIMTDLAYAQLDRGDNCAECIHASYCSVLRQQLEQEVEGIIDAD